jgi:hypothetical protein
MMTFNIHPKAEDRRRSAALLIKMLLANKSPEVLPEHLRELLDTMLWKISEADGKYKTRHQSHGALECNNKRLLQHDHVYPKKRMIDVLLAAKPEEVDGILANAIGCTVTKDEHLHLSKFDDEHSGWDRYRKAGILVVDTSKISTASELITTLSCERRC